MILGGVFYNSVGPKTIMKIAFLAHVTGIILTIFAGGYVTLVVSTLFIGFGNGCTEAACNPMIADSYPSGKVDKMLNWFHMWLPGSIVIGSIVSKCMTDLSTGWKTQIWIMLIPAIIYFFLDRNFQNPSSKKWDPY